MLSICTRTGCATIVFGRGTCVEHDGTRVTVAEHLLVEAVTRSDAPRRPEDALELSSPGPERRPTTG